MIKPGRLNLLTDVPGIRVGNAHDGPVRSGVTVILPDAPAVMAADVRGGGPGSRDIHALDPNCLVERFHGLVLSGGSVFGLDAAGGVVNWLSQAGIGLPLGPMAVPVVPSAILFDLNNGGDKNWGDTPPYRRLGLEACEKAAPGPFSLGNTGAGFGAQAGAIKGGLGSASAITGDGLMVAALVAVNSFGSVTTADGSSLWADPWAQGDEFSALGRGEDNRPRPRISLEVEMPKLKALGGNTTIAVIATNATLTKAEAERVAIMAQDGIARAIRPIHTPFDGDTVFVMATSGWQSKLDRPTLVTIAGSLAADCLTRAIARGVLAAESLGAVKSYRDTI
jgi:L-aminopeptidase/D-esterase-like protein